MSKPIEWLKSPIGICKSCKLMIGSGGQAGYVCKKGDPCTESVHNEHCATEDWDKCPLNK
jgi:hypothetical protein